MEYIAKLTTEDGHWLVEFPDCPGCQTFGETKAEALEMANEALEGGSRRTSSTVTPHLGRRSIAASRSGFVSDWRSRSRSDGCARISGSRSVSSQGRPAYPSSRSPSSRNHRVIPRSEPWRPSPRAPAHSSSRCSRSQSPSRRSGPSGFRVRGAKRSASPPGEQVLLRRRRRGIVQRRSRPARHPRELILRIWTVLGSR